MPVVELVRRRRFQRAGADLRRQRVEQTEPGRQQRCAGVGVVPVCLVLCRGGPLRERGDYDGSLWSVPVSIDPSGDGLPSVSCPSASFCVAVDNIGNVLTYDGSSWSAPSVIDSSNGEGNA